MTITSAVLSFARTAARKPPMPSFSPALFQSVRQMAASGSTKHHFMVYAPDHTDPGALQRRLGVREKHLERVGTLTTNGVLKVLGPTLTPESILPGAEKKMNGSLLVVEASSIEEVKNIVETDVFYSNDVWDKEKIVITPMILALPK